MTILCSYHQLCMIHGLVCEAESRSRTLTASVLQTLASAVVDTSISKYRRT